MRLNYSACCLVFSCFFICISFPTFAQEAFRHPAEVIKSIKPSVEEVPYAFAVADRVQIAISNGCPVVVGVVEAIDDNQLSLTIQDEFSGSGNERGRIPVSLNGYKRRGGTPNSSSPWRDVKIEVGKQLVLAKCNLNSESRSPAVVVSNEDLFVPIKDAIFRERLIRQDPSLLLPIAKGLSETKDLFNAGYIFSLLRSGVGNRDVEAVAESEILKNGGDFPRSAFALLRIRLRFNMDLAGEPLNDQTRKVVLANVMEGAINKKGIAREIFPLLCGLLDRNEIDVAAALTPEIRDRFISSYQAFRRNEAIECDGLKKFENQLKLN